MVPVDAAAARIDIALRTLRAGVPDPRVHELLATLEGAVAHALALMRFQKRAERGDPFHHVSFGRVPLPPEGPMFPRLAGARELAPHLVPLLDALDDLQRTIVYEANCQESIDALNTSRQYLHAAGTLGTTADVVVELARVIAGTPTA